MTVTLITALGVTVGYFLRQGSKLSSDIQRVIASSKTFRTTGPDQLLVLTHQQKNRATLLFEEAKNVFLKIGHVPDFIW